MNRKLLICAALALMLVLAGCVGPKGGGETDSVDKEDNRVDRVAYPQDDVVCYVFHPYEGSDGGGISCVPMNSDAEESSYD